MDLLTYDYDIIRWGQLCSDNYDDDVMEMIYAKPTFTTNHLVSNLNYHLIIFFAILTRKATQTISSKLPKVGHPKIHANLNLIDIVW